MTIGRKLAVGNLLFGATFLMVIGLTWSAYSELSPLLKEMGRKQETMTHLNTLQSQTLALIRAEQGYIITRNESEFANWTTAFQRLLQIVDTLERRISHQSQKVIMDDYVLAKFEYREAFRKIRRQLTQPDGNNGGDDAIREVHELASSNTVVLTRVMAEAIDELVVFNQQRLREHAVVADRALKDRATVAALLFSIALLLSFVWAWRTQWTITGPLVRLLESTKRIGKGNWDATTLTSVAINSKDELGDLADAFQVMVERLKETVVSRDELMAEMARRGEAEAELERSVVTLERSNSELDEFAYIASHDLKEPLRGIGNYAAFLLEDYAEKLDAEGRSKLETLTQLAGRMEAIINSLLYYSRLGRLDLSIRQTDLNEIVAEVLESVRITIDEQSVAIRIPRPLPTITCDSVRISEVFRNFITNALKYNDKQERWIEIGYTADDSDSASVPGGTLNARNRESVFYVRDNGIGIREKHIGGIFRIFKRLHGRGKFGGGEGAGLTFVKKILERHGGRLWAESTFGEGTTFYFTIENMNDALKRQAA